LLGLIQHAAEVERNWFRRVLTGEDVPSISGEPKNAEGHDVTLRWIYAHMIAEYARHIGHADLVRERIDGRTGL
jgi:hypothetical protein